MAGNRKQGGKAGKGRGAQKGRWVSGKNSALLTDLYQLTMLQAYWAEGLEAEAVFDFFIRPTPQRNFLLVAGVESLLDALEGLRFTPGALEYLRSLALFDPAFLDHLRGFRFRGRVDAMPEGTVAFPHEPLVRVSAPLPQAQLIETLLINQVQMQTLLASKGARVVLAAGGRPVVDFGLRRMAGADAGVKGARALWIAGIQATSNVLAGRFYGLPVAGTMAHSYVLAHDTEQEAFQAFARSWPETTLLVDTFDTLAGVKRVVEMARDQGEAFRVRAIRLDSGDLGTLARQARQLLDAAGLQRVGILASGNLDEWSVARLVAEQAPIDGFGVGTRMGISADLPVLDCAYKMAMYASQPRMKLSTGKVSLPGRKQVFRRYRGERMERDSIDLESARGSGSQSLLVPMMIDGRRTPAGREPLARARERAARELAAMPPTLASPDPVPPYLVSVGPDLARLAEELERTLTGSPREWHPAQPLNPAPDKE